MNTSIFLSISVGCIGAVAAIFCATPALAQGEQHIPASGYCTGDTIQISGWEHDLVRRNKGLEKFHWSAINTVQHYNVVPAGSIKSAAKTQSVYHNAKPTVISNWANLKGSVVDPAADKTFLASADNASRAEVNGRLRSVSTYGQMGRPYEASNYGSQQAQYSGERSSHNQVSGRVMHY